MTSCRAAALAALLLASAAPGAFAEDAAHPGPAQPGPAQPGAAHRPHRAATARPKTARPKTASPKTAAAPAATSLFPGADHADSAAERAASLERRRKAFFSPAPDGVDAPTAPAAPVGVTLGGSGGLTPGLGLKF